MYQTIKEDCSRRHNFIFPTYTLHSWKRTFLPILEIAVIVILPPKIFQFNRFINTAFTLVSDYCLFGAGLFTSASLNTFTCYNNRFRR